MSMTGARNLRSASLYSFGAADFLVGGISPYL